MKKNNKNKKGFSLISGKIIFAIQVLVSALTLAALWTLNLVPTRYFAIIVGVLIVLLLVTASILRNVEGKTKGFLKILSLLLSLVMGIATLNLYNGNSFINSITDASKDTHVISIIVLDDSEYKEFKDVSAEVFGANTTLDSPTIDQAKLLIQTKFDTEIAVEDFNDYQSMAESLYSGDLKVMLLNEAHRPFITDFDQEFDSRTRIIGEVSYEVAVELPTPKDTDVSSDTFSIFLSGIDTYGPVSTASRSDVNMIVTVSPSTNQILLTSIPRDYHVILPRFGQYDKLTHAGIYGVGESVAAMENLLGIEIDYYAKVNFSSVTRIVDALGGVNVNSRYSFTGPSGYVFNLGDNYVNGAQALSFVRERYSLPGGDNARVVNQQALVTGILNKAMSSAIITNFNSVLSAIDGTFEMSMSSDSFKALVKEQASSMKSWEIIDIQLSGYGAHSTTTASMPGWDLYVMEPNQASVQLATDLINAMENGEVISQP